MPIPVLSGPSDLVEFAKSCQQILFAQVPHQFVFPVGCSLHHWPVVEEIKSLNGIFLKSLRNRANVYMLSVRLSGENQNWTPVYAGERKSAGLRGRITDHLIITDKRTGSMLKAVKDVVAEGGEIGVSLIKVEPDSLRLFIEETIIAMHKNQLPWNTHG